MTGEHVIEANVAFPEDVVLTDEAIASLVGQRPTVTKGGNWSDPLGRAYVKSAERSEDGVIVTLAVSERTMRELGHVDPVTGETALHYKAPDYSFGYSLRDEADVDPDTGRRTIGPIDVREVARCPRPIA